MENERSATKGNNEKLPFKVKLAYGLSGYTSFITWTVFSLYGLYFFTDVVGMAAAFAGAIISFGTIWDAVTDPLIGTISDNIKSEKGRRRPLIIGAAVPFALISVLLFTNFGFSEAVSKVYFVIIILFYYTAQTVLDISSSALGSEMTLDYDERSSLATYKNFFCMAVTVIVSPTLMLVTYFGGKFENTDFGWSCTLAVYMVIALIFIFILWNTTKGYERHRSEETCRFSFNDIKALFKNKSTRIVMIIFALGVFANTVNLSIQVYYYTYYVGMKAAQIASVTAFFGIACCVGAIVIDVLCKKLSKKSAWLVAMGIEAVAFLILIGFIIKPGNVGLIYVQMILMTLGTGAIYQVPWSMIPDCVDVNELATGKRTDGVIFGFVAFLQKVAGAVAIALVGSLLTAIGYIDGVSQSSETLEGLKNMYAFLCGGIFLVATLVVLKYPLSKERHNKVLKAIDEKNAGKEVDMAEFRDLI